MKIMLWMTACLAILAFSLWIRLPRGVFFRLLGRFWFFSFASFSVRRHQRRLMFLLIFSVAILIATTVIFAGFEQEFSRLTGHHKRLILYPKQDALKVYDWLKIQEDVDIQGVYGQRWVEISDLRQRRTPVLVVSDPAYRHQRALGNLALISAIQGAQDIKIHGYDFSGLLPRLRQVPMKVQLSDRFSMIPFPMLVISMQQAKKLGPSEQADQLWFAIDVPASKNIVLWLRHSPCPEMTFVDVAMWNQDIQKALFSQRLMMSTVFGLLLMASLLQLRHFLEDVLDRQKLFWCLLSVHGVSRAWMMRFYACFAGGLILMAAVFSVPCGLLLAYAVDPCIRGIEWLTQVKILDPALFLTDHIPVSVRWGEIAWIEGFFILSGALIGQRVLRRARAMDVTLVFRND